MKSTVGRILLELLVYLPSSQSLTVLCVEHIY